MDKARQRRGIGKVLVRKPAGLLGRN
ncbi:hypothetical protein [Bradyrhizobium sp. USDA 4469]